MAVEHGAYDSSQQMWYCGYWMTEDEWLDIHDYAPTQHSPADDTDSDEE